MTIRSASARDLDAVLRIERAAFSAPHWPWEAYEHLLSSSAEVLRVLLVAEGQDGIAGFAGGSLVAGESQLESIAVAEREQRRGTGRELCRAFLEWSQQHGAGSVHLEVRASSEGAQRLYAGLGFVALGRRPRYYSNPVEDGIVMICPVPQVGEENTKTRNRADV